jgi:competence protein ComEA
MIRKIALAAALFAAAPAFAQTATAPAARPVAPTALRQTAATPETMRLDINAATQEQLAGLKGFTPAFAEAIVKGRPFKSVDELTSRKIIPADVFAQIKDQVTVGHK